MAKAAIRPQRADQLLIKAVGHPLRVQILAALGERESSPKEMAGEMGASISLISYHVRRLEELGFVELAATAQRRGFTEHYYRLIRRALVDDAAWKELPPVTRDALAASALDQIRKSIVAGASCGGFDADDVHATSTPLLLDAQARAELAGKLNALLEEAFELQAQANGRVVQSGERPAPTHLVLLHFDRPDLA
mgnify:CR=1 FL=1